MSNPMKINLYSALQYIASGKAFIGAAHGDFDRAVWADGHVPSYSLRDFATGEGVQRFDGELV